MTKQQAKELVAQMTLEEKASLCSGSDFWTTKPIERLNLPRIMMTDGPHGLRKQAHDSNGADISGSVPATCFPTSCATGASFDRDLLHEIGEALGEECLQEEVSVLLGPGINLKRSPLCGRNFEYFSEDPYLAGELTTSHVSGVQSTGVGTSLKHFAVNNQETRRLTVNAVVDERALREMYLAAFETVVKRAQPWTIMGSYNQVNGAFASENERLLTTVLREEWGFEGAVVSDWGACNDRVEGVRAGLDLEMPGPAQFNDAAIVKAVRDGLLDESELDTVAIRNVELIQKGASSLKPAFTYDVDAHHALARRAAAQSAVLLKNQDGILPLAKGADAAVIGAFAQTPRYQGAGSSLINPTRLDNPIAELEKAGLLVTYAEGYDHASGKTSDELIAAACEAAKGKDVALVYAGLPDCYESEGFDRETLDMPEGHNRLIEEVAKVNPNTVVVLMCGAPVVMPWAAQVKAILLAYLGGQAVGGAVADLLCGKANPCGKLAETLPKSLSDTPCARYFPGKAKTVEYRESIFVGYRYYDAAGAEVAYPFGYGLSYTTFEYSGLKLSVDRFAKGDTITAEVTVTNTGARDGAEIVQLYIGKEQSAVYRAPKELRGVEKVFLKAGQSKTVRFALCDRSFSYYNTKAADWAMEGGAYTMQIGASSRDIRLTADLDVQGDGKERLLASVYHELPSYFAPTKGGFVADDAEFETLYGAPVPAGARQPGEPYTMNSIVEELTDTPAGRDLYDRLKDQFMKTFEGVEIDLMTMANFYQFPLRSIHMMTGEDFGRDKMKHEIERLNAQLK